MCNRGEATAIPSERIRRSRSAGQRIGSLASEHDRMSCENERWGMAVALPHRWLGKGAAPAERYTEACSVRAMTSACMLGSRCTK